MEHEENDIILNDTIFKRYIAFLNPVTEDEIGRLTWDDGTLKFEGNAEESAKVFFEYLRQFFQA
jgi:hypothetical protein